MNDDEIVTCKHGNKERLDAAEEFCYTFLLAIELGLLEDVSLETRKWLAESLEEWWKHAYKMRLDQKNLWSEKPI